MGSSGKPPQDPLPVEGRMMRIVLRSELFFPPSFPPLSFEGTIVENVWRSELFFLT